MNRVLSRLLVLALVFGLPASGVFAQSKPGEVVGSQEVNENTGGFTGTLSHLDDFGSAMSAADTDGDGVADMLAVGAPRAGRWSRSDGERAVASPNRWSEEAGRWQTERTRPAFRRGG